MSIIGRMYHYIVIIRVQYIYIYIHIDIKVYCREEDHQAGFLITAIESLLGLEGILCCDHLTKRPFIALLNNHVMLQEEIVYCLCLFV